MSKLSMTRQVTAAIAERGPSTLDDICPLFPGVERKTLQKAIGNARVAGLLHSQPVAEKTFGFQLVTYVATKKASETPPRKLPSYNAGRAPEQAGQAGQFWQRRVSSVFDLGNA